MMAAKTAFLAILSIASVLSNPIPRNDYHGTALVNTYELHDDVQTRNLMNKWNTLRIKWSKIIDDGLNELDKIKHQGESTFEVAKKEWKIIREKGLHLIDEVQKTYFEIKQEGKVAYEELKKLYTTLEEAFRQLKSTGHEAVTDAKDLLDELKKSVNEIESIAKLKQTLG